VIAGPRAGIRDKLGDPQIGTVHGTLRAAVVRCKNIVASSVEIPVARIAQHLNGIHRHDAVDADLRLIFEQVVLGVRDHEDEPFQFGQTAELVREMRKLAGKIAIATRQINLVSEILDRA
jgi:hypothetical protein